MTLTGQERQISLLQGTFFPAKMATEWVLRFRKEGAGAILDQLGIETDDDFHEPDEKEAARLYGTLKPMQQRRF